MKRRTRPPFLPPDTVPPRQSFSMFMSDGSVEHTSTASRADLLLASVEAEASGDAEAARKARDALAAHDAEAETHIVIDYERGCIHKRERIYRKGKLIAVILDD